MRMGILRDDVIIQPDTPSTLWSLPLDISDMRDTSPKGQVLRYILVKVSELLLFAYGRYLTC
jgi:hypothetical protein